MKDSERRKYEMFARVREFGAARAGEFAAGSLGSELFAGIGGVVEELNTHGGRQTSSASAAVQGTTGREGARTALREDLEAISRTARAMAFDTPGLEDRFRLPRSNRNDQTYLNTARAFLADAEPLKAEFIRHELPADFLEDLRSDIEDFEQAIAGQNLSAEARTASVSAIEAAVERGAVIVRQLDAVVRNKYRDDSATLAAWVLASHTERPPRTSRRQQPPQSPTTTTPQQ